MKKIIFFLSLLFTSTLMLVTACGHNPVSPLESTSTPTTGTSNSTSTATNTLTNTPTNTASGPTATFTNTATNTATSTATNTPTNTIPGPTSTFTNTATNTATSTATNTPTNTVPGPTSTFTNTPTSTATNTATNTPTDTIPVATSTFTDTATSTATNTATNTPTDTIPAPTATFTDTVTNTATDTPTNTPTSTATNTPTNTFVPGTPDAISQSTQTQTSAHMSPTITVTPIFTDTPNNTVTATPTSTPFTSSNWSLFAQLGQSGSSGTNGNFQTLSGIAIGAGYIVASDTTANNLQVFDDNGNYLYNITPTPQPNPSQLHGGIAIDSFGEVYFCDSANGNVEGFILGPSSATYDYTWSGQGHLVNPNDVKIDPQGNLVVADNFNGLVFNFAWTDDTLLNNTTQGGFNLAGVALDASGNIYATNQSGTTAQVVEYDYAYNYLGAFSGSGWPTPLSLPIGIAVDSQSNLWIVDTYNSRVVQATTQGQYLGAVSTGLLPPSRPQYLTFDAIGSLFVTDPADFVIDQFLYN